MKNDRYRIARVWGLPALLVFATACQGYRTGSFQSWATTFDGERRTVGCLDVSVAAATDSEAEGPVVAFNFGNGCNTRVIVDLSSITVIARTATGEEMVLRAFDPEGEIRPLGLNARRAAGETIEFETPGDNPVDVVQLCIDLSRIDPEARISRPIIACIATGAAHIAGGRA